MAAGICAHPGTRVMGGFASNCDPALRFACAPGRAGADRDYLAAGVARARLRSRADDLYGIEEQEAGPSNQ